MPHVGILPAGFCQISTTELCSPVSYAHHQARFQFLHLPHPRTGIRSLYLPCPTTEKGNPNTILEIQSVNPPNPRSWFTEDEIISDGKMLIMIPVDPAFILIPILKASLPTDGTAGPYRPMDDIFAEAATRLQESNGNTTSNTGVEDIITFGLLSCVRIALPRVCNMKKITEDITVYRYSQSKVADMLQKKVARLVSSKEFESSRTITRGLAKDGLTEDGNENLLAAGRIRAACDLVSQYIPPDIKAELLASYDFSALDAHCKTLREAATRTLPTENANRQKKTEKAPQTGDSSKKRKGIKASQGVEKLKKANTKGMAKISSFFNKA